MFNLARSLEDAVSYQAIEQLKDGVCFSSKYEARLKSFPPPHVIVFANFAPKLEADVKSKGKLSKDRIWLIDLDEIGGELPEQLIERKR